MNSQDMLDGPDLDRLKWKPATALRWAYAALGIPFGLLVFSWFVPFMRPRWDSSVIPLLCLIGGVIPAIIAISLSTVALRQQRSSTAVTGLILGLLALPVCLAISWWLGMMGIASHPV